MEYFFSYYIEKTTVNDIPLRQRLFQVLKEIPTWEFYTLIAIEIVLAIVLGLLLYLKRKKAKAIWEEFTYEDALVYTRKMAKKNPTIHGSKIMLIENEETGEKTVVQTMLDEMGKMMELKKDIMLGRMVKVKKLCPKLTELLADDVGCDIML